MSIKENYQNLLENIEKAASKVGKSAKNITVVIAAKYATIRQLKEVIAAGARHIGENRAQDLLRHQETLGTPKPSLTKNLQFTTDQLQLTTDRRLTINNSPPTTYNLQPFWHFIGHLQTNKINKILGRIHLLQSLDSLRLAKALHKRLLLFSSSERNDQTMKQSNNVTIKQLPVLIEINITRDPAKFGIDPDNLYSFIEKLVEFNTLRIQGLMTMGKIWQNEKEARSHFAKMRQLFESLKQLTTDYRPLTTDYLPPFYLSMGMSSDYQWAIEEGANMVRVGRVIFSV